MTGVITVHLKYLLYKVSCINSYNSLYIQPIYLQYYFVPFRILRAYCSVPQLVLLVRCASHVYVLLHVQSWIPSSIVILVTRYLFDYLFGKICLQFLINICIIYRYVAHRFNCIIFWFIVLHFNSIIYYSLQISPSNLVKVKRLKLTNKSTKL